MPILTCEPPELAKLPPSSAPVATPRFAVRPWQRGDDALLRAAQHALSLDTLYARFFTGTRELPPEYLRHLATAGPPQWDAVLATAGDSLVGWAEYARAAHDPYHEAHLGIVVVDGFQRRGASAALLTALSDRCRRAGVTVLHADVLPHNTGARRAIRRYFGDKVCATRLEDGVVHTVIEIGPAHTAGSMKPVRNVNATVMT